MSDIDDDVIVDENDAVAAQDSVTGVTLRDKLSAKFDRTYTRPDGRGGQLTYGKGSQYIRRLNDVFGFDWEFLRGEVRQDGASVSVEGTLKVYTPLGARTYQQFGSCKINGGMAYGDAVKGAATDALKKCAMMIGIGLYLSESDESDADAVASVAAPQQAVAISIPTGGVLLCDECGDQLTETKFRDGTAWNPAKLAEFGVKKHGRTLCMAHYRTANQRLKAGAAA